LPVAIQKSNAPRDFGHGDVFAEAIECDGVQFLREFLFPDRMEIGTEDRDVILGIDDGDERTVFGDRGTEDSGFAMVLRLPFAGAIQE